MTAISTNDQTQDLERHGGAMNLPVCSVMVVVCMPQATIFLPCVFASSDFAGQISPRSHFSDSYL